MRNLVITIAAIFAFAIAANAQTASSDCPHPDGCVTISRGAAMTALQNADKVTALETEAKALKAAVEDMRDLLNKSRIEFAEKAGENTALKQNAVQDRAVIGILLTKVQKKCILALCF